MKLLIERVLGGLVLYSVFNAAPCLLQRVDGD